MKRDYEEAYETRRYLQKHYWHALTHREQSLHFAATLELKAQSARSEELAIRLRSMAGYFFDHEVAVIIKSGLRAFEQRCCDRLLHEHAHDIYINRCPNCHRIVASPVACACIWCGHHWYERRNEMIERATSSVYPAPHRQQLAQEK